MEKYQKAPKLCPKLCSYWIYILQMTTFRLGAYCCWQMWTCKVWLCLTFSLSHSFWKTSGNRVIYIKLCWPTQEMDTEKVVWLKGPRLTLQHWLSPTALVIITSLTEKWKEAGCRTPLELRQSGRGTTGPWLSGARRDAEVEQGGRGISFFYFPS